MKRDKKIKDFTSHTIIRIAMEVHREMRPEFSEAVYHESLEIEFWFARYGSS